MDVTDSWVSQETGTKTPCLSSGSTSTFHPDDGPDLEHDRKIDLIFNLFKIIFTLLINKN